MRIIRSGRRNRRAEKLTLKVDVLRAKELVTSDPRTCRMVAGVVFNCQTKRTQRIKKTTNPVWNSSFKLQLSGYTLGGPIIHVAVFDKHRKYNVYLGEVRFSIIDLFEDQKSGKLTTKIPAKWYKLHSSESQNAFVTGAIKLSFELISLGTSTNIFENFRKWQSSLIQKEKSIKINEQDFYYDTDTEVESALEDDQEETSLNEEIYNLNVSIPSIMSEPYASNDLMEPSLRSKSSQSSPDRDYHWDSNNSSDASESEASNYGSTASLQKSPISTIPKTIHSIERNTIKGVVFLEIISATGLPPYRSFLQKGFDMDPFVVISFGKKTFRTAWRKHTINPVFNQNLAFEVLSSEQNFDLFFNILDKDHISYNDNVAVGSLPISEVMDNIHYVDYDLSLRLHRDLDYDPHLKLRIKFKDYKTLKNELWFTLLSKYCDQNLPDSLDISQLTLFLEEANIDEDIGYFFDLQNKTIEETLTINEIIEALERHKVKLGICPICEKKRATDMAVHVAICDSKGSKLKSYATAGFASKRWYSKVLIKFAYGKYALGKNNANILVQDRLTGFIIEEKMSLYIRLGIRLLYKGKGADGKRTKRTLKNLSIKQGAKFDQPSSARDIDSFIKFHSLDLSESLETEFKTFNEFFYRKLKPGSRPPESTDPNYITSPADSRCTAFNTVSDAKEIWVKGRRFTVQKLLGDAYTPLLEDCSLAIFRLAPQDYHRFHSPVDGVIGEPVYIQGEYYTVNPMAVRSELDVFGENVRVVIPIDTKQFGLMHFISVGAMMVGSTILTVKKGDVVKKTDELGYFKFGGSTIITLYQKNTASFDSDLLSNSSDCIETLVRVGMIVGHSPSVKEFSRQRVSFDEEPEDVKLKIIRTITGGNTDRTWEYYNLNLDSETESDGEIVEE